MSASKAPDRQYYRYARPEVEELVPPTARTVIDIGCGEGMLGRSLKDNLGCRVVGIELDPAAAAAARERLDEVYEQDAVGALAALPAGSFEVAVAADILEHLPDP